MTEALVALLVSPKWILQKIQINVILKVHINIVLTVYTPVLFLFDEGLSCILFQCEYSFKGVYCLCGQFQRNDCILQLKHEFASFVHSSKENVH